MTRKLRQVNFTDDVLDITRLVEAYQEDRAGIAELLVMACKSEQRYMRELRTYIASNDQIETVKRAHSIKGSAANIGAMRMSRVAAEIENRARRGRLDALDDLLVELDLRYAEMTARVAEFAASVK